MSDYLNVDGVIDITVKDKFGNIKTKNTVRNAVSDLGKMIFLRCILLLKSIFPVFSPK